MTIIFTPPGPYDLEALMAIENAGFSPDEAASKEAMAERIALISDSFIVARELQTITGYVVGPIIQQRYITDDLFETTRINPDTGYQSILSLVVHPDYQGRGIAAMLLNELKRVSKEKDLKGITLTCLKALTPYYEKHGFINEGISSSTHAGSTWYNLVYTL